MKKAAVIVVGLVVILGVFYGVATKQKETLPVPEYPVTASFVEEALVEAGLPWVIAAEDSWRENQKAYTLNDEEGRMIATISSGGNTEERILILGFMPSRSDQYGLSVSLPEEQWENAFVFATVLYGGFESNTQVYDDFIKNRGTKETVGLEHELPAGATRVYEETTVWKHKLEETQCIVSIGQPDLNLPQKDFCGIRFYNSDIFVPDKDNMKNSPIESQ